ncbi:MAG: D-alanyl-D-alanine carboxypeptidase/D-alanyl-D-alanine-endopeptidase, partial [Pseudomonadota bacterium]
VACGFLGAIASESLAGAPVASPAPTPSLVWATRKAPPKLISLPTARPSLAPEVVRAPKRRAATLSPRIAQDSQSKAATLTRAAPQDDRPPISPYSGKIGFLLTDLDSGRVLSQRRAAEPFIPASVTKLISAFYALDTLGDAFRFATYLKTDGRVDGDTLKGDLYLQGTGDPTLDTADLARMVKALAAQGIRRVEGDFIFDAEALPIAPRLSEGQPIDAPYNPSISGLNLNFNRVLMKWQRAKNGKYALDLYAHASKKSLPAVSVVSELLPRDDGGRMLNYRRLATVEAPEGASLLEEVEAWTISKQILGRRGSRWLPVQRPGAYAATTFHALAREAGIEIDEPEPGATSVEARIVHTHLSKPMRDIVRGMLKYSTNLTAEALGLAASELRGLSPLSFDGSAAEMSLWVRERFGLDEEVSSETAALLANHSGLTPRSRMSPEQTVSILRDALSAGGRFEGVEDLIPAYRSRAIRGAKVRAKTGTMYYGRGLAGVIECTGGPRLGFAIYSTDLAERGKFDALNIRDGQSAPKKARRWLRRAREVERRVVNDWVKRKC